MTKFTPSQGQLMKMSKMAAFCSALALSPILLLAFNQGPVQAQQAQGRYKYEGNLFSRKFHQPNCPYSLVMARFRKIMLDSKKQALAEGYRPCRFCLAKTTRTVQAKLINLDISRWDNLVISDPWAVKGGAGLWYKRLWGTVTNELYLWLFKFWNKTWPMQLVLSLTAQ